MPGVSFDPNPLREHCVFVLCACLTDEELYHIPQQLYNLFIRVVIFAPTFVSLYRELKPGSKPATVILSERLSPWRFPS